MESSLEDKQEMEVVIAQKPEETTQSLAIWTKAVILTLMELQKVSKAFAWDVPKEFVTTGQVLDGQYLLHWKQICSNSYPDASQRVGNAH